MEERFQAAQWRKGATGSPVLEGALVSFDCRFSEITWVGTHDVLFCEVLALTVSNETGGLVWFDRGDLPLRREAR